MHYTVTTEFLMLSKKTNNYNDDFSILGIKFLYCYL